MRLALVNKPEPLLQHVYETTWRCGSVVSRKSCDSAKPWQMPWELARFMLVNSIRCLVSITFIEGIKQVGEIGSRAREISSLTVGLKATYAGDVLVWPLLLFRPISLCGGLVKAIFILPSVYTFI